MIYRVIIMKKFTENMILLLKAAFVSILLLFCMMKSECVKEAVSGAVMRCLTTVIPSLYAMMIVSGLLINSGILNKIPKPAAFPARLLLKMDSDIFLIYILSQFAGYPVGAKMLCSAYDNKRLSKRRAELLMGVCYGAGPAFIFGCISSQLYSGSAAGRLIIISSSGANLLLAFLLSFKADKPSSCAGKNTGFRLSSELLTESILSGGRSMAVICFTITAFSVLSALLQEAGIISFAAQLIADTGLLSAEAAQGLVHAFLDVTAVNGLPHNNYELLPVICGLSSFGGICVIFQISAVTSGRLSLRYMIIMRAASAILSGIICRIIMPYFIADETVSAAEINVSIQSSPTPFPSLILIIMTFIVFSEFGQLRRNKNLCKN